MKTLGTAIFFLRWLFFPRDFKHHRWRKQTWRYLLQLYCHRTKADSVRDVLFRTVVDNCGISFFFLIKKSCLFFLCTCIFLCVNEWYLCGGCSKRPIMISWSSQPPNSARNWTQDLKSLCALHYVDRLAFSRCYLNHHNCWTLQKHTKALRYLSVQQKSIKSWVSHTTLLYRYSERIFPCPFSI